jgi:hypothetical protein
VTYVTINLESGVAGGAERVQAALRDLGRPAGLSVLSGGRYQEQIAAQRGF